MENLSQKELDHLHQTIQAATDAFTSGNYPVGACLTIEDTVIAVNSNKIFEKKSFTNHAELQLIIDSGSLLFDAYSTGKKITLYSSLEPCIQCLGAAVTNHIDKIVYITKDPNGGACDLSHSNIGNFYKNHWPEIIYAPISKKPLELMLEYFRNEIKKGNTKWPMKMLRLYDELGMIQSAT